MQIIMRMRQYGKQAAAKRAMQQEEKARGAFETDVPLDYCVAPEEIDSDIQR